MNDHEWTFPPELLARIIQSVNDGRITRNEGIEAVRRYLDATYPDARTKNKK